MFEKLVTKEIASLVPYPPGKPLEELERELGISGAVKLASNENPLGPSPKAIAALREMLPNIHRYPDGSGYYLKRALAEKLNVRMEQIVLGNGSNEIIELAVRTFLQPGMEAVFSNPTFLVYSKVVQGGGGAVTQVPLKNYRHDLSGLRTAVSEKTRLLFIDNPNNPTGTLTSTSDLKAFLSDIPEEVVVIMDEAYIDFVRSGDLLDPVEIMEGGRPVIFLRTFSKAYGLAGLRVGFGLAHQELVDYMDRVRQPFNVNKLAQAGALAALEDDDFYRKTLQVTWDGLEWLSNEVKAMGLKPFPTETNFMMIEIGCSAKEVSDKLLHEGVIARSLSSYGLDRVLRINAGLPEENRRFVDALKKVMGR